MSSMSHATISKWQRDEEGGYTAEFDGWVLKVKWHPEPGRGFSWEAEGPTGKFKSDDLCEEIEVAMAHAEAQMPAAPVGPTEDAPAHGHAH
jgi:hypothetical protein